MPRLREIESTETVVVTVFTRAGEVQVNLTPEGLILNDPRIECEQIKNNGGKCGRPAMYLLLKSSLSPTCSQHLQYALRKGITTYRPIESLSSGSNCRVVIRWPTNATIDLRISELHAT